MDQGIDRRRRKRISSDQQRVIAQRLSQLRVVNVTLDHAVHGTVTLESNQLRSHSYHAREVQERRCSQLHVALFEYGFRVFQEAQVTVHVARIHASDLLTHAIEIVRVLELTAVLPAQPVHRIDRNQVDVVTNVAGRERVEVLETIGRGDNRRPCVECEAFVVIHIRTPAGLVAAFQQRGLHAGRLQANRQREPAESGTDDDRAFARHLAFAPGAGRAPENTLRSALDTGTGGLPDRILTRSSHVVRPA